TGSLDLDDTLIDNFDLGSKMKAIQQFSALQASPKTTIRVLSSGVSSSPVGTTVSNLKLVVPAVGELTGSGTISPQKALDFKMRANLKATGNVLSAIGTKGDIPIPFTVGGTASDPVFRPDVKGIANEKLQDYKKDPAKAIKDANSIIDLFRKK